jgi:hypothetical protein
MISPRDSPAALGKDCAAGSDCAEAPSLRGFTRIGAQGSVHRDVRSWDDRGRNRTVVHSWEMPSASTNVHSTMPGWCWSTTRVKVCIRL